MDDVDYNSWAEYIRDLFDEYDCENPFVLELASGTCSLAEKLKNLGIFAFPTDNSLPMLSVAGNEIPNKVCCDMRRIPFKRKFDFVFSAFDSVNYLLTKNDLRLMIESVSNVLTEDGIFTFDVSLENNSLNNLEHLNRKGKIDNIELLAELKYDEKAGFELINVLGKLFYNNNVELIFLRNQLIDRSASVILFKHSYAQTVVGKKLKIQDSLLLANVIAEMDLPHAKLDIGKLNLEWTEEKKQFNYLTKTKGGDAVQIRK